MKKILVSLGVVLLVGCQSVTQSVNIFQLSSGPQSAEVNFDAKQLLIKRVAVVDYLKQSNIVFEGEGGELIATRYQLWAEPIDKGISRSLINDINNAQSEIRADDHYFTRCREQAKCYSVEIYVEKFYPSFDSTVKFAGKYKLYHDDKVISQHDFSLQKDLNEDGYSHAVATLDKLVSQLGQSIVKQVSQLP
ncbi:PqiC family protein [Psychrobium sp. MM17-31]|uniref:PqiC family protein n=1 Tax=Psychrobium sp. MM17-31 TaxID=2917758 RepID=UPI001EF44C37|nr:PqiC family protein [Psychrobium sp. MM17-31]MCG7530345.1 PqiC family protein [Psychrobium sp. MM17-31]